MPAYASQDTSLTNNPTVNMSSISKACLELSNSIKGLRLSRNQSDSVGPAKDAMNNVKAATATLSKAIKSATSRVRVFDINSHLRRKVQTAPLGQDDKFLSRFFMYFSPVERCVLAQVCTQWRDILYQPQYWVGVTPVVLYREWNKDEEGKRKFYVTLQQRGFDSLCLFGATDKDITDFVNSFPPCRKHLRSISMRCSNISDTGLEMLLEKMLCVYRLELSGCNEITEAGLWSCLNAKIISLSISDCINVADDSIGAVAQLLPSLYELNLQAYHVTDAALSFFSAKQSYTLNILRLHSCWEITNHGIINIVHSLPNLTTLSVSGCSKITDEGIELIAENLRKLRSLDLSWCPRITDAALEYIACDLGQLEELTLDRCTHITDIGVGYLSTMTSLTRLFLRWCTQLRDFGLQHLYTMKSLKVLSLAGCNQLTKTGISGLVQMRYLEELELTNSPGATKDVCQYLRENMYRCLIVD